MWEFISFILFGFVSFILGLGVGMREASKEAIRDGSLRSGGIKYRVTKEE